MARRYEFSRKTRREALKRSGGLCEAIGSVYGLTEGQRCNAPLSHGVDFDHYPVPATVKGSDTIDNCVAVCRTCHLHKTRTLDIPVQAKTKRVSDKHLGIRKPSQLQGRGFSKSREKWSAAQGRWVERETGKPVERN